MQIRFIFIGHGTEEIDKERLKSETEGLHFGWDLGPHLLDLFIIERGGELLIEGPCAF